jgi:peptidoglycan/LPS O-acetylase OafA/YrhL
MQQIKNNFVNSNLISIDIARGFAALSVFIYHYGLGSVLEKATGSPVFNAVSIPGAVYAVPLFFLVSGFCIHQSQLRQEQKQGNTLNYKKYIVRRFWRIYPTYLVALLFSCAVRSMENQRVEA